MSLPTRLVEIAFASRPFDLVQLWTDVTPKVSSSDQLSMKRGRSDEWAKTQTGTLGFVLDNSDNGDFTPGNASSVYAPNVKINRKVRYSHITTAKNLVPNPGFESGLVFGEGGWYADSIDPSVTLFTAIAWSTAQAHSGTHSMRLAFSTFDDARGLIEISGLKVAATYTAWAWLFMDNAVGSPGTAFVAVDADPTVAPSAAYAKSANTTTTTGTWQRKSVTFVATASTMWLSTAYNSAGAGSQYVYVDEVTVELGSSVTSFDAAGAVVSRRFTGYVNDWVPDYEGAYSRVAVTASDRLKPLTGAGAMFSMLAHEILGGVPEFYYPLTEPSGSVSGGDLSGKSSPALTAVTIGAAGTVDFGNGAGPLLVGQQPVLFTRPGTGGAGTYLAATLASATAALLASGTATFTLEAWINVPALNATMRQTALLLDGSNGSHAYASLELGVDTSGNASFVANGNPTAGPNICDGLTHHLAVTVTSGTTLEYYVDGTNVGADTTLVSGLTRVTVGGAPFSGQFLDGSVSHIALTMTDAVDLTAHVEAGTTGFAGERSDQRIARIARYAGVPSTQLALEVGDATVPYATTEGVDPVAAMRTVEDAEQGLLFIDGAGRIALQSRSHRYGAAAVFTAHGPQIEPTSFSTPINDVFVRNDVTYNRNGGANQRVVNQGSVDELGRYPEGPTTVLANTDDEVLNLAAWRTNIYGAPAPRVPDLTFDVLTLGQAKTADKALATAVLGTELGDLIAADQLPVQAPASSMEFFVEGVEETCSETAWLIKFPTSPVLEQVWILEDPVAGYIDSTFVVGL